MFNFYQTKVSYENKIIVILTILSLTLISLLFFFWTMVQKFTLSARTKIGSGEINLQPCHVLCACWSSPQKQKGRSETIHIRHMRRVGLWVLLCTRNKRSFVNFLFLFCNVLDIHSQFFFSQDIHSQFIYLFHNLSRF